MEFNSVQSEQLKTFIDKWLKNDKYELETTFGVGGVVDSNTFLQIAKRLRSKGFENLQQEDYLNIITPKKIRLTLQGINIVQDYCRTDTLYDKTYNAIIKEYAFANSNIDIDEYNIRFKVRSETIIDENDARLKDIIDKWDGQLKAFRLIRRWSFKGKGVRIDMSMVRQTPTTRDGYEWATSFLQRNIMQHMPRYEVEVELLRDNFTSTATDALKSLIVGVGEVQRAIQKNSLLIRNSVVNKVRDDYTKLTGENKFRGVGPVTLQISNMISQIDNLVPNIRTGYNVTDKADGLRTMGFVNESGELFLVDQSMNVYRTGLQNKECAMSIVDGEWVTTKKDSSAINHYLLFDIYYYEGKKVSNLPFITVNEGAIDENSDSRYNKLKEWYMTWTSDVQIIAKGLTELTRIMIAMKVFKFASANNDSIFTKCCNTVLNTEREYNTDGLIITSNSEPIPEKSGVRFSQQFKWKPSKDNTIDFLIQYERDDNDTSLDKVTSTIDPDGILLSYKTMRLYVGGDKGAEYANPRGIILLGQQIDKDEDKKVRYKPILFNPTEFSDTLSSICNVKIEIDPSTREEYAITEDSHEPIANRSIVEMRYDPSREPGWRWIPSRIRHDKTERLLRATSKGGIIKYSGTMNDEGVANSVWNSIHEPITESMIRNGHESPTPEEIEEILKIHKTDVTKKYYERKAPKADLFIIKGLQEFHNKYIKNDILISKLINLKNTKYIIDFACGKAGDLNKWIYNNAKYVLGVDTAGENITNPFDGAYARYLKKIKERTKNGVPKIAFVIGDSSKKLIDGTACSTGEEANMLRSIFGRANTQGTIPPYIQSVMANSFREGADIGACMFALHYFFEDTIKLDGFLSNLADTIKIGGYFVGCCFDGEKVFHLLRNMTIGQAKTGFDNEVPIWKIVKDYDKTDLSADDSSIGLGIDVEFISIGSTHKEYLVPFELLKMKLANIGFRLLNQKELNEVGLKHSTNTFDNSYNMIPDREKKIGFNKHPSISEFSFLNRWFIFKRDGIETPPERIPEEIDELESKESKEDKESKEERKEERKEEMPQKMDLTLERVFRFGTNISNAVTYKDSTGKDITDMHASRYISLLGYFPIPDDDDPTIIYPSIEHYIAGRRISRASNNKKRAKDIFSQEGKIHQLTLKNSSSVEFESPKYFTVQDTALKRIKDAFTPKGLETLKVTLFDDKWNGPTPLEYKDADDYKPVYKDYVLNHALHYRYENDKRFQSIINSLKENNKHLVYTIMPADSKNKSKFAEVKGIASEFSGYFEDGAIKGENKVGEYIMKLANF